MCNNIYIKKCKEKEEYIYAFLKERRSHGLKASLKKDKWKVALEQVYRKYKSKYIRLSNVKGFKRDIIKFT